MSREKYTVSDITVMSTGFKTKDGVFHTKRDSSGFSYWYKGEERIGHYSYDYVFAIPEGLADAVKKLNKLINQGC